MYKHGYTRDQILESIIETPRTPKQIAEYTGIDYPHVKVVIGRLHKDGKVIRYRHVYLCAPHAVPWHLQRVPDEFVEDYGEDLEDGNPVSIAELDAIEAEYQEFLVTEEDKYIITGLVRDVEEEIEALEMVTPPGAAIINSILPDVDDYVEPQPILCTTRAIFAEYRREWNANRGEGEEYFDEMLARVKRENAEIDIRNKKEGIEILRKARKNPNYKSMALMKREAKAKKLANKYARLPSQLDPNGDRLEELEAERARLRHHDKEDPA